MKKIFISYSYKDNHFVNRLRDSLLANGFQVIDFREEVNAGDVLLRELYKSIRLADVYIFIISEDYNKSNWQSSEIGFVLHETTNNSNKLVLPIVLDKNVSIPPSINHFVYSDFTENKNFDENFKKLVKAIASQSEGFSGLNRIEIKNNEIERKKENVELEKTLRETLNSRRLILEREKLEYEIGRSKKNQFSTFNKVANIGMIIVSLGMAMFSFGLLNSKISINKDIVIGIIIGASFALIPSIYFFNKLSKGGKNGR